MNRSECTVLRDLAFQTHPTIRYFGFLDNRDGMILSELRREETSRNPEKQLLQDLTFFKGAMSSWSMYFGQVKHAVVSHEHFKIILVPIGTGLAIVTADSSFPLSGVDDLAANLRQSIALQTSKV
jgi:hypothetical protein